ncbi:MAG: DUF5054 domain-containing protein, partial [Clostridia bacterium]
DVPGHTIAMLPYLAKRGIKLIHIGVNPASAVPNTPECFLWKYNNSEVIVIYSSKGYGGEFSTPFIDDILYFDHTPDNCGAKGKKALENSYKNFTKKYAGYEVVAGSLDDYAEKLWQVKDKLPVVTAEIGDTWIHGVGSAPQKVAFMRELENLIKQWINDKTMIVGSEEYDAVMDNLLCIAEHTWGFDLKRNFADYENYLRKDFDRARKNDNIKFKKLIIGLQQKAYSLLCGQTLSNKNRSYTAIEKSWIEQQQYALNAVDCLSENHKKQAESALDKIKNVQLPSVEDNNLKVGFEYCVGKNSVVFNEYGGIAKLIIKGCNLVNENCKPAISYMSYGKKDFDLFHKNYTRDISKTRFWATADFGRPLLKYAENKYSTGIFYYKMTAGEVKKSGEELTFVIRCDIDNYCFDNLGAPKSIFIKYILNAEKMNIVLSFKDKPANRLCESLAFRLYPNANERSISYYKLDNKINPYDVVVNGNRNLSAVQKVEITSLAKTFTISNFHSPLVALGEANILNFDNKFKSIQQDGLSFVLSDNIWGTNFPLWQEGNGYFEFEIKN